MEQGDRTNMYPCFQKEAGTRKNKPGRNKKFKGGIIMVKKRWKVKQVIWESFLPHLSSAQPLGAIACWIHAQSTLDRQPRPSFKNQHAKHGYQLSFSCCLSMSYWINNAEPFLTLCSPAARLQPLHLNTPSLYTRYARVLSRAGCELRCRVVDLFIYLCNRRTDQYENSAAK